MKPLKDQFPISTFTGEIQERLIKFVELKIEEAIGEFLNQPANQHDQEVRRKAFRELKVDLSEWVEDKILDQGTSNGYYNAMHDLIDKLK
jgi:hypothetical protein